MAARDVARYEQEGANNKDVNMGFLDGLLGQVAENADVKNLAAKVGLTPDQVESAVAALAHAHSQPSDTVETAAETTGLPTDALSQIVEHLGGEGALGKFAGLIAGAGEGGLLSGLAGSLFGKKA